VDDEWSVDMTSSLLLSGAATWRMSLKILQETDKRTDKRKDIIVA